MISCTKLLHGQKNRLQTQVYSCAMASSESQVCVTKVKPRRKIQTPYCCYLLTPEATKLRGRRSYVGFTVNPTRRLRQHNRDLKSGGAKKTAKLRPWEIVTVVVGFPNKFAALAFEYAWQYPYKSRLTGKHLKALGAVTKPPTMAQYRTYGVPDTMPRTMGKTCTARKLMELQMILATCLPFSNFPLEVNFQQMEFKQLSEIHAECFNIPPFPTHVQVTVGDISSRLKQRRKEQVRLTQHESEVMATLSSNTCTMCKIGDHPHTLLLCTNELCSALGHPTCWSKHATDSPGVASLLPSVVRCPECKTTLSWPNLIGSHIMKSAVRGRDIPVGDCANRGTTDCTPQDDQTSELEVLELSEDGSGLLSQ